ncbi:zinc ribbon domain-containing protein [Staphylococcus simiae]|uniref:Membrane-associated protein n=1 Tax=Staphylococcus simiae CCM 7213 = CCUG 51256 TaxID=911238 RepID=G5JG32_9STAP|nr:zinc-ribbon domain-containing protein [Staphylococcus simiae]EHJ08864.1 tcaA protein [Staphylococcus simiae CCM 7213 = CCUG 51256]PNZ13357.1 zinc ribbon domain-containing protein [Staphylococcus simiae]SNV80418.1 Teicoplanin resistance associated membrane protein TcaA [Staphylococcus simiae]
MKSCPKCGKQVKDEQKSCPQCGHQFDSQPTLYRKSSDNEVLTGNLKLRKIVPWAIGLFIIILLIILFLLLKNFNSPEAQSKILVNAIENNDKQKVATILSTKNNKVDSEEAEVYIQYIKDEVGTKQFVKELEDSVHKLNNSHTSVATYIKSKSGQNLLRVSKNGTRYIFFDNMSFTAPSKQPIVKPKVKTKYEFKSNGKKKVVIAEANKTTPIGNFIPGNYHIPTTKTTDNGVFSGSLNFDFKQSNSETVDITEDFDEANINVTLKGDTKLSDKSKKVTINDKEMAFSKAKSYGPYPQNKDITISASGKAKGKTFTTQTKTIKASKLKSNTEVTLSFDSEDINDYVAKKEKEENSLKNKLTQFFAGYSMAINSAFSEDNFNFISTYLKKDTTYYNSMKKNVSQGNTIAIKSPEVVDVEQDGKTIKTTLQLIDNSGQVVTNQYELEDNAQDRLQLVKKVDD